jgi:excisionase family DNA binding protein
MNAQIFLNGITIDQLAIALKEVLAQKQSVDDPSKNDNNDLITREETCRLLSVSKTTLWKHTKRGKLKSYGMGNRVYYKQREVLNALQSLNF